MVSFLSSAAYELRVAPAVVWDRVTFRGRGVLAPERDVEHPGVARRSIVVASTERTGSTLLVASMRGTGSAGVPYEYFNGDLIGEAIDTLGTPQLLIRARVHRQLRRVRLRRNWAATWDVVPGTLVPYLEHIVRCRTTPNGVFATKMHWEQYVKMSRAGLTIGDFPQPVSWVYVSRRDRVAQAVSLARARRSGVWSAMQEEGPRRRREPVFDATAISKAVAHIDAGSMGWESFFADAGITPIRVVYEDLVADYGAEMSRLFDQLGLEAVVDQVPPTRRQADAVSAEWIERFRADMPGA